MRRQERRRSGRGERRERSAVEGERNGEYEKEHGCKAWTMYLYQYSMNFYEFYTLSEENLSRFQCANICRIAIILI